MIAMLTAIILSAASVSQAGVQSSTVSNPRYPPGPPTAQPSCRLDGCTAMEYPQPGGYRGAESGGAVCPCDGYGRSTCHPPSRVLWSCWYCTSLLRSCCRAALCPNEENCQRQSGEMTHVGHTVEENDILCFSRQDKPTSTPTMVCDVSVWPPPSTAAESTAEESTAEESTVEESTTEESTTEESTTEESTVEESTTEESTVEESTTEESTTEESTTEESTTEESTTEESTVESTAEESTVEESTTEESTAEESTTEESMVEESTAEESTVESTAEESTVEEEEQDPERRVRKLNTRPRQLLQTRAGLAQR